MLVVPTSRRVAPLTAMMSGMRKLPPISMSWPREMTTSFPWHSARSAMTVAAAQFGQLRPDGRGDDLVGVLVGQRLHAGRFQDGVDRREVTQGVTHGVCPRGLMAFPPAYCVARGGTTLRAEMAAGEP